MKRRKRRKGCYALLRVNGKGLLAAVLALVLCTGSFLAARALAEEQGVEIPVVMYHSVLKDEAYHGKYVISPAEFESDLNYLQRHGYTTVLMEDLIAYTQGAELPEKPVLLTFDDGYYNNYLYAFQIARQHRCKFVLSPICLYADLYTEEPVDNAYYAHATWPQLREMVESGLVEVQNHTYDLHKNQGRMGMKKLAGESEDAYRTFLKADLEKAQELIKRQVGKAPTTMVYPFGAVSPETLEIVKGLGFAATLSCEEKVSRITRDPQSLYNLGRFLRTSGGTSQDFFEKTMKLAP